jgi:PAS domain S-box-containing protein
LSDGHSALGAGDPPGPRPPWLAEAETTAAAEIVRTPDPAPADYRSLFEHIPVGLYRTTPEGRFLDANRALAVMLGYPDRDSLLAVSTAELYLDPDDRRRWRDLLERYDVVSAFEYRHRRRDGSVIWVQDSARTVRGPDGRVLYYEGVVEDITEKRRAAEALRAGEERYRRLFESIPSPMWVCDLDSLAFLAVNDAAVQRYGYSREEFRALTICDIRPPEDVPALLRNVATAREKDSAEVTQAGVWRHVKKDGTAFDVEITSHAVAWDGRRAQLILAIDVTERKALEAQLRQAQKMEAVGRLAGGLAHDFNNLLTAILGYSHLALRRLGDRTELRREIEEIGKAGERAAALTAQLLAFSRKQVLQTRVLDLNVIVRDMDKMLRRLIGEDVDLVACLGSELGRIRADPGQVEQVLLNLAVNARDAMPRGGKLTIETANVELGATYAMTHPVMKTPGRYVLLAVSDNGCGMDAETQSHIFEPFFTTKEAGKGTGLGLATVYGIVKQSGGYIWVYSEPGQGTSFKIYLPRTESEAERLSTVPVPVPFVRGSETVLLVEDEDALRALARQVLEESGYRVLEARRAEEGLLIARGHQDRIHLLLTDVVMPGASGPRLAEQMIEIHPQARVVYMSGYTDGAVVNHGLLEAGAAFLQKPFTPQALAAKVREVLDGS